MTSSVQNNLLNQLSFPVPVVPSVRYIPIYSDPNTHINSKTTEIINNTIQQAVRLHQTSFQVSAPLKEQEKTLLIQRNSLDDGLKVNIVSDPANPNNQTITISIDYNPTLSRKIFREPLLPVEQKVVFNSSIEEKQMDINIIQDMDIIVNDQPVMSINFTQWALLTKDSPIVKAVKDEGVIRNNKGIMQMPIEKFNTHPSKAKPFMEMVLNQSVPSNLSIEDISIYLDWAEFMGASNTKNALLNLLVKHPGLEKYCDNPDNRKTLKIFSQTGVAPAKVKQFFQEYVSFYGNTHFDQLSVAEKRELEIVNHPFYRGDIDASQAGATLKDSFISPSENGLKYLLRESSHYGHYTLSVRSSSKAINHYRFSIQENGELLLEGGKEKFKTLADLVQTARNNNS